MAAPYEAPQVEQGQERPSSGRLPRWAEAVILSFVAGIATGLPTVLLVIFKKASLVSIISLVLACIAIGAAFYSATLLRRVSRRTPPPMLAMPPRSTVTPNSPVLEANSYAQWQASFSEAIFKILWSRNDPAQPMDPVALATKLSAEAPTLTRDLTTHEMIRAIEEIRILRRLPSLERDTEGFFLRDDDFMLNKTASASAKKMLATTAANYVRSGMSVAFDGGTTTLEVARTLILRIISQSLHDIRVTSSSIQICSELLDTPESREAIRTGDLQVWSMAGPLHASCWTMDPPPEERLPWKLDVAIIGANGITEDGFFMPTERGLPVKRIFINSAPLTVIVADSTKIGKKLDAKFATWEDNVVLVTDRPVDRNSRHVLASFPKDSVVICRESDGPKRESMLNNPRTSRRSS